MEASVLKLELLDWLLHINDEVKLNKIASLKNDLDSEIIAHTISGEPLNKQAYKNFVEQANQRISSGKFTTMKELCDSLIETS
jgi:hypothetical protein